METNLKWLRVGDCLFRHDRILDIRTAAFADVWTISVNTVDDKATGYLCFNTHEEAMTELARIQKELQSHD